MWIGWLGLGVAAMAGGGAESPTQPEIAELNVLCTNVWGLVWPLSQDRRERLPRVYEEQDFATYDLVAVQELWRGARRRVDGPWFGPDQAGDSGLALAGRLAPGARMSLEPFDERVGVERLKRKGILVARVALDGFDQPLWVYVTHFQAGGPYGRIRLSQARQLARLLGAHDGPALVLGDFNLHAGNPIDDQAEAQLFSAGLTDVAMTLDQVEPTYVASNPYAWTSAHGQRFDRVYLRDGGGVDLTALEIEVLHDDDPVSDHQPLRVRLRVGRTQEPSGETASDL